VASVDPSASIAAALRARAAMLSALGEHGAASVAADCAAGRSPTAGSYALRAEVRLRAADRLGALADVERGLALDRDDPRLLVLRGRMATEAGDLAAGLRWFDRALFHGATGPVHVWRARTMVAQGRHEQAVEAWSAALADDPDDPETFLARARCMRRLGHWENALADLERAAERAPDGSSVLIRVTLDYLACLPARPDRLTRVVELARRSLVGPSRFRRSDSWIGSLFPLGKLRRRGDH
jgi:tetratricopeptide (TPR) repeat protein